jgi:hypothetical protein
MPVTTLHLSSENSVRTSSGHHELRLEPGLQIPHTAKPTCYLHDLSFSNTVVNISKSLYNNSDVILSKTTTPALDMSFTIPDGSYDLVSLEKELAKQIRTHPTLSDVFYSNTSADASYVDRNGASFADDRIDDKTSANSWDNALSISQIQQKIDDAVQADKPTALNGSYIKPITLEADLVANRVRIWMPYELTTVVDNGVFSDFLGFEALGAMKNVLAKNNAKVDRARAISVNVPSIVSGVYSSSGRLGGSQLALVPITAEIGRSQAFTASVPIKLRAKLAGTILERVSFHLSSEDGDPISLQGERFDIIVVIEW